MALKYLSRYWYLIGTSRCPLGSFKNNYSSIKNSVPPLLNYGRNSNFTVRIHRHNASFPIFKSKLANLQAPVAEENLYAFNILRQNEEFSEKVSKLFKPSSNTSDLNFDEILHTTWSSKPQELIQQFELISDCRKPDDCFFSHEAFTQMTEALISSIKEMNDEEIFCVLRNLAKWPLEALATSGNFFNLWKAADQTLVERHRGWTVDKALFAALHWYLLGLPKKSDCMHLCLKKVGRKPHCLSRQDLVQFMFFVNINRCYHPSLNMLDVEWAMYKNIDRFSIHELAILCLGFFKSETYIRETKLINALLIRLTQDLDVAHSYTVVAILKAVRFSARHWSYDYIEKLLSKLAEQVDKYPLVVWSHVCSLMVKTNVGNNELVKKLAQKLRNEIKTARIKDIATLVGCLTTFNHRCNESPNVYELAIDEFRHPDRENEIMEYPKILGSFVSKLVVVQMYPEDMISKLFSKEYLVNTFGKKYSRFTVPVSMLQIHYSTKLESPSYQGPLFDPEMERSMSDHVGWYMPRQTDKRKTDKMISDVACIVAKLLGGENFTKLMYTIPSFIKCDVIFCLDEKTNKVLPVPEDVKAFTFLHATLPSKNGKWYCLYGISENSMIYRTKEPIGYLKLKSRLLSIIGYKPLFFDVTLFDWLEFSGQEKENAVKKLINFDQIKLS